MSVRLNFCVLLSLLSVQCVQCAGDEKSYSHKIHSISERSRFTSAPTKKPTKGQEELDECGCPDTWIRYNGSCYMIGHQQGMYFMEAKKLCEQLNGYLVHVNSAEENNFLKQYLSRMKDSNYWIGANDRLVEGVWNYVDTGDLITFTDWTPGQPDSWHAHNEDCALFYFPHQYMWDDGPCEQNLEPICEIRLSEADPLNIIG